VRGGGPSAPFRGMRRGGARVRDERAPPLQGRHPVRATNTIGPMHAPDEASLYPLFLKLGGRPVLVGGARAVAERKVVTLLSAGARIRVVAPRATAKIQQ